MNKDAYIISLRVDWSRLRKDLADAKALAQSTKLPSVAIQASVDQGRIKSDLAKIRQEIRAFRSASMMPPIRIPLQLRSDQARREIATLRRSAASPIQMPAVFRSASHRTTPDAAPAAHRLGPVTRRQPVDADTSAALRSLSTLRTSASKPITIPIEFNHTSATRQLASIRAAAARVSGTSASIPVRYKTPTAQSARAAVSHASRRLSMFTATMNVKANTSQATVEMGQLRTHARQLAASRPIITPVASTGRALRQIQHVQSVIDRLAATKVDLSPRGFFAGRAGMGMAGLGAGGAVGAGAMLAGGAALGVGAAGATYGKLASDGMSSLADLERSQGQPRNRLEGPRQSQGIN